MATLVLSAVGTAIGGPIGGTIGSLIGSQIDAALFGPPDREGPRLQELKVTTSSYGSAIPRHFGKMRAAGTIIWATDLKESSEESGGKGQPTVTTYSYSASFAVALASRRIASVGRIWADGNLLRGAAGDLKVGGEFRLHDGAGDQQADPLIASAEGAACPAYRGISYCVFEELQLAEFGNRIPSLTFEVLADDGEVSLSEMLAPVDQDLEVDRTLAALKGYSDEGGTLAETLASLDRVYPLSSNGGDNVLAITSGDPWGEPVLTLPPPVVDRAGEGFGGAGGRAERQRADESRIPVGLRYYDVERDFQAGMQRAGGRALPGRNRLIEFPGALQATNARKLADDAAERARWSQERLAYRIAEINTKLSPGQVVTVPGRSGKWRIEAWEWRDTGVELELLRLPHRKGANAITESGRPLIQIDLVATPTLLEAFELPWDGTGTADQKQVFAAASSASPGWRGASLYAVTGTSMSQNGFSGSRRSVSGMTETAIPPAYTPLIDRQTAIEVSFASPDFAPESCTVEDLANGANRMLLGTEILQFAKAEPLEAGRWRLSILTRGRGGTEAAAHAGHAAGTSVVLLDSSPVKLENAALGQATSIAAIGLADPEPVITPIRGIGSTLRPLSPVHARAAPQPAGGVLLSWVRRARGAWSWDSTVEVPLVEQNESYEIGVGDTDTPDLSWQSSGPSLAIDPATWAQLQSDFAGQALWVRQIGTFARSQPTFITTID